MPKAVVAYNNFARGKVDHDMMGRFDLPVYRSSVDVMENFFSNFKGNAIFRTGLEDMIGSFQDCVLHEFLFRNDQNYIMVFYETTVRFLTYASDGTFGWVLNTGVPLEVTTPYSLEDARTLQFTQNGDVIVITHPDHPPQDLTRVAADNFTIADHTFDTTNPFTAPNYPAACAFYKGRLYFAATPDRTTTVWGSEAGDFENFVVPGTVTDISPLEFTLSEITQPIEWLFNGENSLIAGCAEGIVAINGGGINTTIKADTIEANLTSTDGSNSIPPISKEGLIFYEGKNSRNVYYFSYDLLTESFDAEDANFLSYDITKGDIAKLRWKKDRDDLVYHIRSDGKWLTLNFKENENIIGWHTHSTYGQIKDIAVISDNDGNPQLFVLALRGSDYYIERLAPHVEFSERSSFFTGDKEADDEAYNRMVAEELMQCIYLDNSQKFNNLQEDNTITYDDVAGTITDTDGVFASGDVGKHISYKTETGYESGRFEITGYTDANTVEVDVLQEPTSDEYDNWYLSFNEVSGLTQYIGETVGVVTDGGFLDEIEITGDTYTFENQILSIVIGYTYRGLIKSFNLGFQSGAENTQITMKAITRTGIRCVASAGGKFGSTQYRLLPLQKLSQNDINYLPPLPIDGTEFVDYSDDNQEDKFFYVVQDVPLPLIVTSVFLDANYSIAR